MDLVEEQDITPGVESNQLAQDPIQNEIVKKKVNKNKPEFRNDKGKRWKKVFNFDKTGMSQEDITKERDKRKKQMRKERGSLRPKGASKIY